MHVLIALLIAGGVVFAILVLLVFIVFFVPPLADFLDGIFGLK